MEEDQVYFDDLMKKFLNETRDEDQLTERQRRIMMTTRKSGS